MITKSIHFDEQSLETAQTVLRTDGVIAFPTDTVYGIGVPVQDASGIERLYDIKERSNLKAIPVLIGQVKQLDLLTVKRPPFADRLIHQLWPGALTLILPMREGLPAALSSTPTIGVRMPDHDLLRRLITLVGPMAVTSANLSGHPNTASAQAVLAQLDGRIDLLLDGGPTPGDIPSTVVDCTGEKPRVLRWGMINKEKLEEVLGFQIE